MISHDPLIYTEVSVNDLTRRSIHVQYYDELNKTAQSGPSTAMRLAHLHLPNITPFGHVSQIQETLTSRFLASKNHPGHAPDPTIITFTPNPVYTTGRRDLPPSNTRNDSRCRPKLSLPAALEPIRPLLTSPSPTGKDDSSSSSAVAEYHPTLRGGQTTYHGPGQLVAYTILDLRRFGLTPRCHIRVLEDSVINVLHGFGVRGLLTDDPGVWIQSESSGATGLPPKKITAVGVHLRRNITSYGIGFNVTEEPMWYFRQIVACGLEGRQATSLEGVGVSGVSIDDVAGRFVRAFVERVNGRDSAGGCGRSSETSSGRLGERVDSVYKIREEDIL